MTAAQEQKPTATQQEKGKGTLAALGLGKLQLRSCGLLQHQHLELVQQGDIYSAQQALGWQGVKAGRGKNQKSIQEGKEIWIWKEEFQNPKNRWGLDNSKATEPKTKGKKALEEH